MHYKQNNKESKSYVQGLRPFGKTLPRGLKGVLKKNGYNYSEIIGKWNVLVGKNISSCSYPKSVKMTRGETHGTLLLAVNRGDEVTIEYSKKEIINKINSYFGYQLINEIRLQTYNVEAKVKKNKSIIEQSSKKLEKRINEIKSEDIRNSLSQLLKSIKND